VVVKNLTSNASAAFQLATGVGNGTLNLNAGTFETSGFVKGNATGTSTINFNGGTLKAGAASGGFLTPLSNTVVNVKNGGAIIDTNGFNITINSTFSADGSGGFRKLGLGRLVFNATSSHTGNTVVEAGELQLGAAAVFSGTTVLEVRQGATLTNNTPSSLSNSFRLVEGSTLAGAFSSIGLEIVADLSAGSFSSINPGTFAKNNSALTLTLTNVTSGSYSLFGGGAASGAFSSVQVGSDVLTNQGGGVFVGQDIGGYRYEFDNSLNAVAISAVPEPSSVALFGAGIFALLVYLRRARA
jgi:autotransporter-associated beta strand protein